MGGIVVKIHETPSGRILAACDSRLLGKRIVHGDIEFHVSPSFYGTSTKTIDEIVTLLEECSSANIIGNHVVGLLEERGIVAPEESILVGGEKHVQIYYISRIRA